MSEHKDAKYCAMRTDFYSCKKPPLHGHIFCEEHRIETGGYDFNRIEPRPPRAPA